MPKAMYAPRNYAYSASVSPVYVGATVNNGFTNSRTSTAKSYSRKIQGNANLKSKPVNLEIINGGLKEGVSLTSGVAIVILSIVLLVFALLLMNSFITKMAFDTASVETQTKQMEEDIQVIKSKIDVIPNVSSRASALGMVKRESFTNIDLSTNQVVTTELQKTQN